MQFSPPPPKLCAGVAQWEERGPRKSVIGVRIAAPAPFIRGHGNVSLLRPREEFACDNASLRSPAGIAQWEEQAHGKRPTAVRGCVPAPRVCWSSTVAVQRACTSPTSVRFTRPAPGLMAGLAEWLRHRIVTPATRVRFSHLAPKWAVRIRGLSTACTREMRVRVSHRPPDFGS